MLMPNALRGLDALGVGAAVRGRGRPDVPGSLRTPAGRRLSRMGAADLGAHAALGVHRAELHRVLRAALPAEALHNAADVLDVHPGPPAEVRYSLDGRLATAAADLVVAADGIRSTVRSRLWPNVPGPAHAGSTAWRAVTPDPCPGEVEMSISWGRGAEFGTVPLVDGRVYWFGAVNTAPGGSSDDELATVRARFGRWHHPIPALLEATSPRAVLRNDIEHLATPLPTFVFGTVALLGDAAHAMTPNLGQGACQAVEDAVVLGSVCAGTDDVPAALAAYDAARRPRSQAVARAAYRIGRFGQQLENPVAIAVRNALLRLVPARATVRSAARHSDWHPPRIS